MTRHIGDTVLEVEDLHTYFFTRLGVVKAVDGVSFSLRQGENLLDKSESEMRQIRGRRISMILQDPQTSLNPVFTIGNQLIEALSIHRESRTRELVQRAIKALKQVRVAAPERRVD